MCDLLLDLLTTVLYSFLMFSKLYNCSFSVVKRLTWFDLKVRDHQNWHIHIHFIHYHESAEFYDNFAYNIGTKRSVNTEKFTFEVDDLQKRRRKRAVMMTCGDAMSLAYRRHE